MPTPPVIRELTTVQQLDGNDLVVGQRRLLNFASNNYLGLAQDPRLRDAATAAIRTWGTGTGASPLLSGHTILHETLAQQLSAWKCGPGKTSQPPTAQLPTAQQPTAQQPTAQQPTAQQRVGTLLFPSGYAANLAVLGTLLSNDAQVFCDRKNHASLIDGLRMASQTRPHLAIRYYRHRAFNDLEQLLAASDPRRERWIVTDSVFSMDGTCTRPVDLTGLVRKYGAKIIVDEAHATGVLGHLGAGLFSFSPKCDGDQPLASMIVVGTLSKALGSAGGFVTCSAEWIEQLTQAARTMIYSTSLPAANVAAASAAIAIAQNEDWRRERLSRHVAYLHAQLSRQGWRTVGDPAAPLLGVIVGTAEHATRIAGQIRDAGVWAPAIRPPTVRPLECRIRLSPSATMTDEEIQCVIDIFASLPAAGRLQ